MEYVVEKYEWNLIVIICKLLKDVLNFVKVLLERLYGIKSEGEEGLILILLEILDSFLEYLLFFLNELLESVKGYEYDLRMVV